MNYRTIYITYTDYINGLDYTRINKIYILGLGIYPLWATIVRGTIHNQFALDEYLGTVLRVVTSKLNSNPQSISIYTFAFNFALLAQKHNVHPGNVVTSTRYYGRRLYCGTGQGNFFTVTFLPNHFNINTYFFINLQGQPRYLHPLNQNILLGFGRGPGGNGLRIWIINVASASSPYQINSFPIPNAFANSPV